MKFALWIIGLLVVFVGARLTLTPFHKILFISATIWFGWVLLDPTIPWSTPAILLLMAMYLKEDRRDRKD
jgi:uncharacterized membrane protein